MTRDAYDGVSCHQYEPPSSSSLPSSRLSLLSSEPYFQRLARIQTEEQIKRTAFIRNQASPECALRSRGRARKTLVTLLHQENATVTCACRMMLTLILVISLVL